MVNERNFDVDTFSISLRDAFGFGRYLCLGSSAADLAAALRGKLIDARTRSSDDGIAPHAVVLDLRGGVDEGLAQLPEIFKSRVRYVVAIHDIKES